MKNHKKAGGVFRFCGGCILVTMGITGALLLLLAFLIYKFSIPEQATKVFFAFIYALASFTCGFFTGKWQKKKVLICGAIAGACYYFLLLLLACFLKAGGENAVENRMIIFFLCILGGILGGIFSKNRVN